MNTYSNSNDLYEIREEMHQGKKHIVLPVVMMVSGVHSGSHGPVFHSIEQLGRFPESWNGIPVSIKHPSIDGKNVSANSPDIIDSTVVGRVYNTFVDDDKLKGEVWLDAVRLNQVSPATAAYINKKQPLEVSLGMFSDNTDMEGIWAGETYIAEARNHRPDHLALLPGGKGACSWEDGCGIRVHESTDSPDAYGGAGSGNFGHEGRAGHVGGSSTAGGGGGAAVGDSKEKEKRFAEGALRQVVGSAKLSEVNIKNVREAEDGHEIKGVIKDAYAPSLMKGLKEAGWQNDGTKAKWSSSDYGEWASRYQITKHGIQMVRAIKMQSLATGNVEFSMFVGKDTATIKWDSAKALDMVKKRIEKIDPQISYYEDSGELPEEAQRQKEESMAWLRNTTYSEHKEENIMPEEIKPCCPEKVEMLIQDENSNFTENDRDWLLTQSAEIIEKLQPVIIEKEVEKIVVNTETPTREAAIQVLQETFADPQKFMALLPTSIRDQLESGLQLHQEKRNQKISIILANQAGDAWTKEELSGMDTAMLSKIANSLPIKRDFSGQGTGMSIQSHAAAEEKLLPPGVTLQ